MNIETNFRQSKYCTAIENAMQTLGHATNLELSRCYVSSFQMLALRPFIANGSISLRGQLSSRRRERWPDARYDANVVPHDHFQCQRCFMLRDADIRDVVPGYSGGYCRLRDCGRLVISGLCKICKTFVKEEVGD